MSDGITIVYDDEQVRRALQRAPQIMARHLSRGVENAANRVAVEERIQAPKAFSTLTNSIRADIVSPFERVVGPHVGYARAVEEGTAGGGFPPPFRSLLAWIKVRRIQPDDPSMTQEGLAVVISRSIAQRGTPPIPFRRRTFGKMKPRVFDILRASVQAGLDEVASQ
jgi:hypothetical protein